MAEARLSLSDLGLAEFAYRGASRVVFVPVTADADTRSEDTHGDPEEMTVDRQIDWTPLLEAAESIVEAAYAPYSKFRVGAAVLTSDGRIFKGCNVENASYGLTICAERAAIFAAVSGTLGKKVGIDAVAIVTDPSDPGSPCGACRQVIAEFGPDAMISYVSRNGRVVHPLSALLFDPFQIV